MDIIDVFVYLAFIVCGIFCILLGGIFILFFRKQYKKSFFFNIINPNIFINFRPFILQNTLEISGHFITKYEFAEYFENLGRF